MDQAIYTCRDSPGIIVLFKIWRNLLINDRSGFRVGNRLFQAVTDFDPDLPFRHSHQENQAIILPALAGLILLKEGFREIGQILALKAG